MNSYKCFILFSLITYLTRQQEWRQLVYELNLTNGSSNWKQSGEGYWQESDNNICQNYFGYQLGTSQITRQINNIPAYSKLKISIEICYHITWEEVYESCIIRTNTNIRTYKNVKIPENGVFMVVERFQNLEFEIMCELSGNLFNNSYKETWAVRNFKVEYLPCKEECDKCSSTEQCICNQDKYKNDKQECNKCHDKCLTCSGPSEFDCIKCKNEEKLQTQIDGKKICTQCPQEGFYVNGDFCKECDPSCSNCKGPLRSNCTQCTIGYFKKYILNQ